jgi:hypothetical protein
MTEGIGESIDFANRCASEISSEPVMAAPVRRMPAPRPKTTVALNTMKAMNP